jgi:hypothetical protein
VIVSSVLSPALFAQEGAERRIERRVKTEPRVVSPHGSERRVHRRLTSAELKWLREARMKYGPAVRLIDVSAGGAQFETQTPVRPNTEIVLHLVGRHLEEVVPSRVLRSHISAIDDAPWYRSACAFTRSIDVSHLLGPSGPRNDAPPVDYLKSEFALKGIVDQHLQRPDAASMLDALRTLHRSAERRADAGDRKLAELVARALRSLEGAESIAAAMASIEAHLRLLMPLVSIRVMDRPSAPSAGAESIYFDVAATRSLAPCVLNVEFPAGFAPDNQQFRLLKACAYLITLLRSSQIAPPPAARVAAAGDPATPDTAQNLWRPVVVRFVDGRLLRGYTSDFNASRPQLHLSPSPDAAPERLLVPLASAKAVFFVKDLIGDSTRVDGTTFDGPTNGRRIEVTFRDGEVLVGSTMNYDPARLGFFLHPANAASNNLRVFVISAAVRHARFLPQ